MYRICSLFLSKRDEGNRKPKARGKSRMRLSSKENMDKVAEEEDLWGISVHFETTPGLLPSLSAMSAKERRSALEDKPDVDESTEDGEQEALLDSNSGFDKSEASLMTSD